MTFSWAWECPIVHGRQQEELILFWGFARFEKIGKSLVLLYTKNFLISMHPKTFGMICYSI